jgi:hypothetical protein
MRLPVLLLLVAAEPTFASAPQQTVELIPRAAMEELSRWSWSEHRWGVWGAFVLVHGIALLVPGVAFFGVSHDDAQMAVLFPGRGYERQSSNFALAGGAFLGFGFTAIVSAIAMFVYQAQGTWHEDAYWESRQ